MRIIWEFCDSKRGRQVGKQRSHATSLRLKAICHSVILSHALISRFFPAKNPEELGHDDEARLVVV